MWSALFAQEWSESQQGQQQSSTCGQCGKISSRSGNLVKHLRHCSVHRPSPPQLPRQKQQQQQYTSMGGAVERYSINMQEAQHLDHFVNRPPPPPTNKDRVPLQTPRIQIQV